MGFILTLVSLAIIFMGIALIWRPGKDGLLGVIGMYSDEVGLQVFASIGRMLLGLAFIVYAAESRLPTVLSILGWLSLLTGLVFLFMPQQMFRDFITLALEKLQPYAKILGVVVVVLGAVILDAVW